MNSSESLIIDKFTLHSPLVMDINSLLLDHKYTEDGSAPLPRSFENRWRNMDILYIILKGILWRFEFNLNFSKIFSFRDFMSNFREITPQWLENGCPKKFKLLIYEHIIYSFEARNLEILNM